MKRTNSRELSLFDGIGGRQKKHAGGTAPPANKQQHAGRPPSAPRRGLHSGGMARSGSLNTGSGAASSGGGGSTVLAGRGLSLPEVTSPPPSKALNFLEMPMSPFAHASAVVSSSEAAAAPSASDRRRQAAAQRRASHGHISSGSSDPDDDWEEASVLEDQENQQPSHCAAAAAAAAELPGAPTWLVSPVRPRPASAVAAAPGAPTPVPSGGLSACAGPFQPSAPRPIPTPVPLFSPGLQMLTPAKEALPSAPGASPAPMSAEPRPSLTHALSFSSWMTSAARPPSPPRLAHPPAGAAIDMSDIAACIAGNVRAARAFEGPRGAPSHLDRLLAELGDSHYPASLVQWEEEELMDSEPEE